MKILSASDIHLDTFAPFSHLVDNPISNSRLENILRGLHLFFKYGSENDIHTYVFNGDTFNNRLKMNPNFYYYCVRNIIDEFSKSPKNSTLYINIGNHDEMTRFINPNSNEIFSDFSTEEHKIVVASKEAELYPIDKDSSIMLIPFTENITKSKESINNVLSSLDRDTYVFAHLGVSGATQGRWSHKLEGSYNLDDLGWNNSHVKSIIVGHFHSRQSLAKDGNKEAWYQGDFIPINFNDVQESGIGAERGFDVINTDTGEHIFKPLTDDLPTFNIIDLDSTKLSSEEITELMKDNYVKIITHTKETEKQFKNIVKDDNIKAIISTKIEVKEAKILDISESSSDAEILTKYCEKFYPDSKKIALEYLNKALTDEDD